MSDEESRLERRRRIARAEDELPHVLGENDFLRVETANQLSNYKRHEATLRKAMPDDRGLFAMDLLRAWGMVSAVRAQETSSGHPTLRVMPVDAVILRAFSMTEQAFAEMERRGWLVHVTRPEPEDDE